MRAQNLLDVCFWEALNLATQLMGMAHGKPPSFMMACLNHPLTITKYHSVSRRFSILISLMNFSAIPSASQPLL